MKDLRVHSYEGFLQGRLPHLLDGHESLRVIAVTYNRIEGFEPGEADSGHVGLSLFTQSRGSTAEQRCRLEMLSCAFAGESPVLAFLYYGQKTGSAPITRALQLYRDLGARAVLVACECDMDVKLALTHPHLESGAISDLVFAPPSRCNGEFELGGILTELMGLWPRRRGYRRLSGIARSATASIPPPPG